MTAQLKTAFLALLCVSCHQNGSEGSMTNDVLKAVANKNGERVISLDGPLQRTFKKLQVCNEVQCSDQIPTIRVSWDPRIGIYKRCDAKGCDSYKLVRSQSGIFTNLTMPDHGIFARISRDGRMTEVLSLMHTMFIYHGECLN